MEGFLAKGWTEAKQIGACPQPAMNAGLMALC